MHKYSDKELIEKAVTVTRLNFRKKYKQFVDKIKSNYLIETNQRHQILFIRCFVNGQLIYIDPATKSIISESDTVRCLEQQKVREKKMDDNYLERYYNMFGSKHITPILYIPATNDLSVMRSYRFGFE